MIDSINSLHWAREILTSLVITICFNIVADHYKFLDLKRLLDIQYRVYSNSCINDIQQQCGERETYIKAYVEDLAG